MESEGCLLSLGGGGEGGVTAIVYYLLVSKSDFPPNGAI